MGTRYKIGVGHREPRWASTATANLGTVTSGNTVELAPYAIVPAGTTPVYTLMPGAPANMTVNPATGQLGTSGISATNTYNATVRLSMVGGRTTSTKIFTVTVIGVANAPVFTLSPTSATLPSTGGTIQFTATDADNHTITYSIQTGRTGISVDPATGLVTVTSDAAGTDADIVVRATDPLGLYTDSLPCRVTVQAVANWEITEAFSSATLGTPVGATSPWYDDTTILLGTMPTTGGSCYQVTWSDGSSGLPTTPANQEASRILFTPSDEAWFKARVAISNAVRDNHLFYFKLAPASNPTLNEWESPTAGGAVYFETRNGNFIIDNRDESGVWVNPTGATTTTNIADGASHELVIRMVLNTAGQSNGIIQVWIDGTQRVNTSNWRFRTNADSKLNQLLLAPYRQTYLTGSGSIWVDNISIANTGTAPQTGTTLYAFNCDALATQVPALPAIEQFGNTTLGVSEGGRTAMRVFCSGIDGGNGGNAGIGPAGMYYTVLSLGQTRYFRFWMRLSVGWSWGNYSDPSSKIGRFFGNGSDAMSFHVRRDGFWGEQYDSGRPQFYMTYDMNPATNPAVLNWQEYVIEVKLQSTVGGNDGHIKLYVNGALANDSNTGINLDTNGATFLQDAWGGFGTRLYPQLDSTVAAGGYIYLDDITVTDFFYTTFTGTAPQTGTTFFSWSGASTTAEISGMTGTLVSGDSLVVEDGFPCLRTFHSGTSQGDRGIIFEQFTAFNDGRGRDLYMRAWVKFSPSYVFAGTAKFKNGRLATWEEGSFGTFNCMMGAQHWENEITWTPPVGFVANVYLLYDYNPATNPAVTNWQEYIVRWRMPTTLNGSDGIFGFYVNGVLIEQRTGLKVCLHDSNDTRTALVVKRGGMWIWTYPQHNNASAGGYIYVRNAAVTDFWSSAYPQGT